MGRRTPYRRTEARAVRASIVRLQKIDALLIEIGGLWGDEDQFLVSRADELRDQISEFRKEVSEQVNQRAAERAERAEREAEVRS